MSIYIEAKESIKINNKNGEGKIFLKALKKYINQFNHMESVSKLNIFELELIVDGKKAAIRGCDSEENNNCLMMARKGLLEKYTRHTNWKRNNELIILSKKLNKAKEVTFNISFDMTNRFETDYAFSYWIYLISENIDLAKKCVEYKGTQIVDYAWEVEQVYFNSNGFVELKESNDINLVKDIKNWYSTDLLIMISSDTKKIEKGTDEYNELLNLTKEISDNFDTGEFTEEHLFYCDEFQLESRSSFEIENLDKLINCIRKIKKISDRLDFDFNLKAEYVPIGSSKDFGKINIYCDDDGEIKVSFLRF